MWYNAAMIPLIQHNLDALRDLCRKYEVKRLELFGSAARGDFTEESDIDFFVEFQNYADPRIADFWFGLQEDLEELFGVRVELTSALTSTNPYFLEVANRHRVALYAA